MCIRDSSKGYAVDPFISDQIENDKLRDELISTIKNFRFAPRFLAGKAVDSPGQYFEF